MASGIYMAELPLEGKYAHAYTLEDAVIGYARQEDRWDSSYRAGHDRR